MSTLTQPEENVITTFADSISALLDHHDITPALEFARGAMEWCDTHNYPTAADVFLQDVCYLEQLTPS